MNDMATRARMWRTALTWAAIAGSCASCGQVIRVIDSRRTGTSEFWVCDGGDATNCRGERKGDIDPSGFQDRAQVVAPPAQCPNGFSAADVVLDSHTIQRVRYECAQPLSTTGLPPSGLPGSGLPLASPMPGPSSTNAATSPPPPATTR